MSYNKKIWENGDLITKERMNNIEDGIYNAHEEINTLKNNTSTGGGGSGEVDLSGYVTKETGNANQITFADGQTFQAKLDSGVLKGEKGEQGIQGPQGDKGDTGEPGASSIDDTAASATTTYSSNKIEAIKEGLSSRINTIENNGVSQEVIENKVQSVIDGKIADGTMANLTIEDYSITSNKLANEVLTDRHFNKNLFLTAPDTPLPDTPLPDTPTHQEVINISFTNIQTNNTDIFLCIVINNPFTSSGGTYSISCDINLNKSITTTIGARSFFNDTDNPATFEGIYGTIHDGDIAIDGDHVSYSKTIEIASGSNHPYLKIVLDIKNVITKTNASEFLSGLVVSLNNLKITVNESELSRNDILNAGIMLGTATVDINSSNSESTPQTYSTDQLKIVRDVDLNYAINSHVTNFHNGSVVSNGSKWSGKKILAIGDSITDKNTPETKYIKFIEDAINCTVTNNGISGSGFIAGNSLVNRINSLSNDYDLIYVFLGTNDYVGDGAPLGEWGSTNTSDFYGAVNYCFGKLAEKYPTKTIAILTPLPRRGGWSNNSKGHNLNDYCEAIRKTAEKHSFPLLDLHKYSGFLAYNPTFNANYSHGGDGTSGGDGLHPNTAWHRDFLAHKVLSFFETI